MSEGPCTNMGKGHLIAHPCHVLGMGLSRRWWFLLNFEGVLKREAMFQLVLRRWVMEMWIFSCCETAALKSVEIVKFALL